MNTLIPRLGFTIIVSIWNASVGLAQTRQTTPPPTKSVQKLFEEKNYQKVVDILEPKSEKLSVNELLILGKAYSQIKNSYSAGKIFQLILAQEPKNAEVMALLGEVYLATKKEKEGLQALKDSLSMNPKNTTAYSILIQHYERLGNKYELRLIYEDMNKYIGETDYSIRKLCELYTSGGIYDLSKKFCTRGIEINKKLPENYINLAISLDATGDSQTADATFIKAVGLFPKSSETLLSYAKHLEEQKKFSQAYGFYKKSYSMNPASIKAALGTAFMGIELQKFSEALPIYQKICKKSKETLIGFRKALSLMRTQKDNPTAQQWLPKYESALGQCDQ